MLLCILNIKYKNCTKGVVKISSDLDNTIRKILDFLLSECVRQPTRDDMNEKIAFA